MAKAHKGGDTVDLQAYDAVIFTDGSARGNPGRGGWGMVVVLPGQKWVDEFGDAKNPTTNNEMELTAIVEALHYTALKLSLRSVLILSDSSYCINGAVSWVSGWKRRGWKTATGGEVANLALWQELEQLQARMPVEYMHIKGHSGIPGNERTDVIATGYADDVDPRLYSGKLEGYGIQTILNIAPTIHRSESSRTSTPKDGWYVSYVQGRVERHQDWSSCKARVHGVAAKYKKVSSDLEEAQVLKSWGL